MSLEIRIATSTDAFEACNVLRRSIVECCSLDHRDDPAILEAWLPGTEGGNAVAGHAEPHLG